MNGTPPVSRSSTPQQVTGGEDAPLLGGSDRLLRSVSPAAGDASRFSALADGLDVTARSLVAPSQEGKSDTRDDVKDQIHSPVPVRVAAQQHPDRRWRAAAGQLLRDARERIADLLQLGRDHPGVVTRMATYGGAGFLWTSPVLGGGLGLVGGTVMGLVVGVMHEVTDDDDVNNNNADTKNADINWSGFAISAASFAASLEPELQPFQTSVFSYQVPDGPRVLMAVAGAVADLCCMAYAKVRNT